MKDNFLIANKALPMRYKSIISFALMECYY